MSTNIINLILAKAEYRKLTDSEKKLFEDDKDYLNDNVLVINRSNLPNNLATKDNTFELLGNSKFTHLVYHQYTAFNHEYNKVIATLYGNYHTKEFLVIIN